MKDLHAFLKRLSGGRRPPTGPLTTSEAAAADKLGHETPAEDTGSTTNDPEEAKPPAGPLQ